ncbi:hypothetical protein HK096_007731 [Nowakowskiella sp. JEL0078]|nr:hypothetical protein HK096_007731 [Nowakowskiella sp. JEL0078]
MMSRDSTHNLWLLYQSTSASLILEDTAYQISGENTRSQNETNKLEGAEHIKSLQISVLPPLAPDLSSFSSLTSYYNSLFAETSTRLLLKEDKKKTKLSHVVDPNINCPISLLIGDTPPNLVKLCRYQSFSSTSSPSSPPQTEIEICEYDLVNISNLNINQIKKNFFKSVVDNESKNSPSNSSPNGNRSQEILKLFELNHSSKNDAEFFPEDISNHNSSPRLYVGRSAMSSGNSGYSIELEQPKKRFSLLTKSLNQWLKKPWIPRKFKLGKSPFDNATPTESVHRKPQIMYGLSEDNDKKRIYSVPNLTSNSNFNPTLTSKDYFHTSSPINRVQDTPEMILFQKNADFVTSNSRHKIGDEETRKGSFKNLVVTWKSKKRNCDNDQLVNLQHDSWPYQPHFPLRSKSFTFKNIRSSRSANKPDQEPKKNIPWLVSTLNLERKKSLKTNEPLFKSVEIVSERESEVDEAEYANIYQSASLRKHAESLRIILKEAESTRQNNLPKSLIAFESLVLQTTNGRPSTVKILKLKPNLRIVTDSDELYMIRLQYERNLKLRIQERELAYDKYENESLKNVN